MFTKRPDRYTTGLINMRNDCFANTSIQALSALPGFNDYLNEIIRDFRNYAKLDKRHSESFATSKDLLKDIPLHIALATIIKEIQETRLSSNTISVWTFLHVLERIFNARISRSQHDAQELTQLIFEALENENLKLRRNYSKLLDPEDQDITVIDGSDIPHIQIPDFPFSGLTATQLTCLSCQYKSKPIFAPFLMLSLPTPEKSQALLTDMMIDNQSEVIEGYQCLKCRISRILEYEQLLDEPVEDEEREILEKLKDMNNSDKLFINDDLPEQLESYVKSYNKKSFSSKDITSNVLKSNSILKPPKVMGLHLSRSMFNGVGVSRNSCFIRFEEQLNITIDENVNSKLQKINEAYIHIDSKVLTNDVDDIEEEQEVPEDENNDDDTEDNLAEEAEKSPLNETDTDSELEMSDIAASSGISAKQMEMIKESFKNFKFSDGNNYKYKLRAMIRHQGSHSQGHYECYKKKPLFVKDKDGNYFKLFPEIHLDEELEAPVMQTVKEHETTEHETTEDAGSVTSKPRKSRSSSVRMTRRSSHMSDASDPFSPSEDESILSETASVGSSSLGIRKRLSSMVNRRPSVTTQDPTKWMNNVSTSPDMRKQVESALPSANGETPKLKKIATVAKYPYWRISDSKVTEVTKDEVLNERQAVYMLYYERVDKIEVA